MRFERRVQHGGDRRYGNPIGQLGLLGLRRLANERPNRASPRRSTTGTSTTGDPAGIQRATTDGKS